MISKELLSEVLGKEVMFVDDNGKRFTYFYINESVEDTSPFEIYTTTNIYHRDYGYRKKINIYELAHKCKEWAVKDGKYVLHSATAWNNSAVCIVNLGTDIQERFYADTEPEAIFKATQYILDNLKQKD